MAARRQAPRAARVTAPELEPYLVAGVIQTGTELGSGAYGSVEEVKIPGARVAAKKLHPGLVNFGSEQQVRKWISDFVDECKLMTLLRHPNIVQFLGVCYLPDSHLPVLLMEKLQTSLDNLLETNDNIPSDVKLTLLIGTARGVVYLHSRTPTIVHRDLTARNVLIDSGLEAKIADLGVARMVTLQPGQVAATMTTAPGNVLYMPPEAVGDQSTRYNTAIDIFSFGVISLFTLTQTFPKDLKAHTYRDPNTRRLIARSEIERREEYIQIMSAAFGETHPLVRLVLRCLEYDHEDRPSAVEVLQRLEEVREIIPQNCTETKLELIRRITRNEEEIQTVREVMVEKDAQLNEKNVQIESLLADVSTKQAQIDHLQSEKQVQARGLEELTTLQQQQLEVQRTEIDRLQTEKQVQRTEIDQLSGRLRSLELQGAQPLEERVDQPVAKPRKMPPPLPMVPSSITFNWRRCKYIPWSMGLSGQPVAHNGKVYVRGKSGTVFEYTPGRDQWNELPPPPVNRFIIATLRGDLVLVGGSDISTGKVTNTIFRWDAHSQQWLQSYPVMPTARFLPTVVEYQDHLIVASGDNSELTRIPDVNILDTTTNKWLTAESLPNTDDYYRSVLIDGTVYLVGQDTKTVLRAYVPSLISQATPGASSHRVWESLPNALFYDSSPVTIGNALLTVGGLTNNFPRNPTTSIQLYNHTNNQWTKVGDLPESMCRCICTVLSGELVVLGGWGTTFFDAISSVYVATLN